jgi:hypothetical protein
MLGSIIILLQDYLYIIYIVMITLSIIYGTPKNYL